MTIRAFGAKNYGCLRDVNVTLGTRLHAFVGPNDSGKSTLLRGICALLQFATSKFEQVKGTWRPFDPLPGGASHPGWQSHYEKQANIECAIDGGTYQVALAKRTDQTITRGESRNPVSSERKWDSFAWEPGPRPKDHDSDPFWKQLRGARLCQLDASALRAPSGLVPQSEVVGFFDERGSGLPGIYQAILGRGDEAFGEIRESVRRLFPTVKRIAVVPVTRSEVSLEVELSDGTRVRASEMSAGLLYYLAFAAIPYLDPVSVLLLEEPENGLHPARIAEVIRLLRDFAERTDTQIFMATHSPLVLNELAADEISVVTRPSLETGSVVTPLRATPHFEQRSKVYALGELWLAYCDGELEAPLLDARTK